MVSEGLALQGVERGIKCRNGVLRGGVAGPPRPSTPGPDLGLTDLGPQLPPQALGNLCCNDGRISPDPSQHKAS